MKNENSNKPAAPEMILFDSGGTLCYDADMDQLRAVEAIMPYITKNSRGIGAEELNEALRAVRAEIRPARKAGFEVGMWTMMRIACGRCGVELDLDEQTFEHIFRLALTTAEPVPHVDELLDCLNASGMRTGVISNSRFSAVSLKERLDRLFPRNRFEFILSSCDYILCKPNSALFEIALAKAGLNAEKVWYCGDSPEADVAGARGAGLFPVLYDPDGMNTDEVDHDFLSISDWRELIDILHKRR